jgi:hypothetical protein
MVIEAGEDLTHLVVPLLNAKERRADTPPDRICFYTRSSYHSFSTAAIKDTMAAKRRHSE